MVEYDPRLVAPTCLYLASKAEESTVQARLLVFYIKKLCKIFFFFWNLIIVDFFFKIIFVGFEKGVLKILQMFCICVCRFWWKVSIWNQRNPWNGNENFRGTKLLSSCLPSLSCIVPVSLFHKECFFCEYEKWPFYPSL